MKNRCNAIRNSCGCGGKKNSYISIYVLPYSNVNRNKRRVSRGIRAMLKSAAVN